MKARWREPRRFFEDALLFEMDRCIIWPYALDHGYATMHRPGSGQRGTNVRVARLVCERIYGPPPTNKHEAAHSCHTKACINKRHLSWQTHQQNTSDTWGNPRMWGRK